MSTSLFYGRFGNNIFTNLAACMFSEKFNLLTTYNKYDECSKLGLELFVGEKQYDHTITITESNFIENFNKDSINCNVSFRDYFQSKIITNMTHKYLHSKMDRINSSNKFRERYNNNNDCFIHVRLGDVSSYNPGFKYYDYILSQINPDNIYLSTDDDNHIIIQQLKTKYNNLKIINYSLIDTILFGSTNKFVILSHGTFSGIIGYMSFYSKVYFIKENASTSWDYNNGNEEFSIFKDKFSTISQFNEVDVLTL